MLENTFSGGERLIDTTNNEFDDEFPYIDGDV